MFERTVSPEDLVRLKKEREAAHSAYLETLAALDGAIQTLDDLPEPPTSYDERGVTPLNDAWPLSGLRPERPTGWRGHAQDLVWSILAPVLERQQAFNATVVEHVNNNIEHHLSVRSSIVDVVQTLRVALGGAIAFQMRVVRYSQEIAPFVETQTLEASSLSRRINEDLAETNAGLVATVDGLTQEVRKRWETSVATERRLEARTDQLSATIAVAHQVAQTLKRELSRGGEGRSPTPPPPTGLTPGTSAPIDSYKYVGFEDAFRGSAPDIQTRLEQYVEYFEGATNVLDVGCGRGEFLELLRDRGINAHGIDLNHEMVEQCRSRGLTVSEADLRSHLSQLEDGSLGGLFASQVVEHLEPTYLLETLDIAFHRLRPGSTIILETINVASWSAFFQSYIRDITHVRPLHPDTLRYLVTASGFQQTEVVFRSPCPAQQRLERLPNLGDIPGASTMDREHLVNAFNENVDKLNRLMFADQDYAVIAKRL